MFTLIALLFGLTLDPAFVRSTVESLGAVISREYFDPKVGREVEAALEQSLAAGRYAGTTDDQMLATLLNRDLYAATHDKHLAVEARLDVPAQRERSAAQADEARAAIVQRTNAGVRRVEILPGNVGYFGSRISFAPRKRARRSRRRCGCYPTPTR